MDIKDRIRKSGFRQWEIAEKLNINEFVFSRLLRRPEKLSKDKIDLINKAIEELKIERNVI